MERVVKSVHAPCSVFKECGAAPLCHAVSTTLRKRVPRHALSVWDENQWRSVGNKASFLICTEGGVPWPWARRKKRKKGGWGSDDSTLDHTFPFSALRVGFGHCGQGSWKARRATRKRGQAEDKKGARQSRKHAGTRK